MSDRKILLVEDDPGLQKQQLKWSLARATIMADGTQITAANLGLDPGPVEAQPFNLRQAREYAGVWPSAAHLPTATTTSLAPSNCSAPPGPPCMT